MKYYFIVNPAAGQGKGIPALISEIKATCQAYDIVPMIHRTESRGDAERYTRRIAKDLTEDAIFFACGGDGTVHEVVNGIAGHPHAILGILPIGSGNDTIRNFPQSKSDFLSVEKQITGSLHAIDLLHYRGVIDGTEEERFCINMFNNGFDCNVVETAARLKTKPLLSGTGAYIAAIAEMFIEKKGISLQIEGDGELLSKGNILLCSVCNGSYCGGGFYGSPQSDVSDGILEINIVRDTSRRRFLGLLPSYYKGTHLSRKDAVDIISVHRAMHARLLPDGAPDFLFCADGEIHRTEGLEIEVKKKILRIILPGETLCSYSG